MSIKSKVLAAAAVLDPGRRPQHGRDGGGERRHPAVRQ